MATNNGTMSNRRARPANVYTIDGARSTIRVAWSDEPEKVLATLGNTRTPLRPTYRKSIVAVKDLTEVVSQPKPDTLFLAGLGMGNINAQGSGSTTDWNKIIVVPHQRLTPRGRDRMQRQETDEQKAARFASNDEIREAFVGKFTGASKLYVMGAFPALHHFQEEGSERVERVIYLPVYDCSYSSFGVLDVLSARGAEQDEIEGMEFQEDNEEAEVLTG